MHPVHVRVMVCAVAMLAAACSDVDPIEEEEMPNLPPWHMWGNSQTVEVTHAVAIIQEQTTQLARISYGRPESWNFFFMARIVDCEMPEESGELDVNWNLTFGVGRAQVTIPRFERYVFRWGGSEVNPSAIGLTKYSSEVVAPLRSDIVGTSTSLIEDFVAQDIQCSASLSFTGGETPAKKLKAQLSCFFSPIHHIRPEWFEGRMAANEDQGQ